MTSVPFPFGSSPLSYFSPSLSSVLCAAFLLRRRILLGKPFSSGKRVLPRTPFLKPLNYDVLRRIQRNFFLQLFCQHQTQRIQERGIRQAEGYKRLFQVCFQNSIICSDATSLCFAASDIANLGKGYGENPLFARKGFSPGAVSGGLTNELFYYRIKDG